MYKSHLIAAVSVVLAMLAYAGRVSAVPPAHCADRRPTEQLPQASVEIATAPVYPAGVGEPPITGNPDLVEHVYAEGILVELTESPSRDVCFERLSQASWFKSTSSCSCGSGGSMFFHGLHQHCRATYATCLTGGQKFLAKTWLDYQDFYSPRGLAIVGVQVGAAAVLANTSLDQNFQNWHDNSVRSADSDDLADKVRWLGEGKIMIPVFAGAAIFECFARDDQPVFQAVGNWGSRCSRSVLVGGPTVLGLGYLLGASRPIEGRGSGWKPFEDNNSASGHAFMGATAFLNAAQMTECVPLKVAYYGLSTLPAWSRVNDQRHYLSQVLLGWGIAWLAADVADRTERSQRNWIVLPYGGDGGLGLQSIIAY